MNTEIVEIQRRFLLEGIFSGSRRIKTTIEANATSLSVTQGNVSTHVTWKVCTGLWIAEKYQATYLQLWYQVRDYYLRRISMPDKQLLLNSVSVASGNVNNSYMHLWLATLGLSFPEDGNWKALISAQRNVLRSILYQYSNGQIIISVPAETVATYTQCIKDEPHNVSVTVLGSQIIFHLFAAGGLTELRFV